VGVRWERRAGVVRGLDEAATVRLKKLPESAIK